MGASKTTGALQQKQRLQTVVEETETPTQVETTTQAPAPRMAGETFLGLSKRYNPVTTTTTTPGSVTRTERQVFVPAAPAAPEFKPTGNPLVDAMILKGKPYRGKPMSG